MEVGSDLDRVAYPVEAFGLLSLCTWLGERKNEDGMDLDEQGLFLKSHFDLTNKNL
jgi:hypothetical protein